MFRLKFSSNKESSPFSTRTLSELRQFIIWMYGAEPNQVFLITFSPEKHSQLRTDPKNQRNAQEESCIQPKNSEIPGKIALSPMRCKERQLIFFSFQRYFKNTNLFIKTWMEEIQPDVSIKKECKVSEKPLLFGTFKQVLDSMDKI